MERRRFILVSLTAAGAIGLPLAGCSPAHDALAPGMLSSLCDKKTLRAIGSAYLQQHAGEKNKDVLTKLILNANVQDDFKKGNIVVIKGWVLAVTEARQCAFLTL